MNNKTSGIGFFVIGLCLMVVFNGRSLGMLSGIILMIAGIVLILKGRQKKEN